MINTSEDLYDFLVKKDVTRLCHFTKTKNLVHILSSTEGIEATAFIKNDVKHQNDLGRYDGHLEYVCCSIEYPNSWYWEKLRIRDSNYIFKEWVILCIDLDIIKHKKIKFSPCNAALSNGKYIKGNLNDFPELYAQSLNYNKYRERTLKMLNCCPTDDQAEILVYSNIPLRYINKIIVGSEEIADHINAILKTLKLDLEVFICADACNTEWSKMVRNGIRPEETKFTVG